METRTPTEFSSDATMQPIHIQVTRNFTIELIAPLIERDLKEDGLQATFAFGGFSSAGAEISALASGSQEASSIRIVSLGLEEAGPGFGHVDWPVSAQCDRILQILRLAVATSKGMVFINTLLPPLHDPWGLTRGEGYVDQAAIVEQANLQIRDMARAQPGRVVLCDWIRYARILGEAGTYDARFWMSSGAPFAQPFLRMYARDVASALRVQNGRVRKCLILDCDNTLWGGVVGEMGISGIALGDSGVPGRYFLEFQRTVLDLAERGILIALCSKNEERDVLDVLESHPECLLKRRHVAALRINWLPKADNIRELARELNIGLESLVFVDDSPIECDQVRALLPEVRVARLPERLEEIPFFLHRTGLFDGLAITREDLERAETYQHQNQRRELQLSAASLEDYLRTVGTKVSVRKCRDIDVARVAQLTQRTNQFNLTTLRCSESEIRAMCADGSAGVYCADVADRFGGLGLTVVMLLRFSEGRLSAEGFMMSCRALGRHAEFAVAGAVLTDALKKWGDVPLVAAYVPTEKNKVAADFWERCGLREVADELPERRQFVATALTSVIPQLARDYISVEFENA